MPEADQSIAMTCMEEAFDKDPSKERVDSLLSQVQKGGGNSRGNEEAGEDLELKEEVRNDITLTPNSRSRVHLQKLVTDEENYKNDEDKQN